MKDYSYLSASSLFLNCRRLSTSPLMIGFAISPALTKLSESHADLNSTLAISKNHWLSSNCCRNRCRSISGIIGCSGVTKYIREYLGNVELRLSLSKCVKAPEHFVSMMDNCGFYSPRKDEDASLRR